MFNSEWIEKHVKIKPDKVVTKLYDYDGTYKTSVIIPTVYYPLCNNNIEVFTSSKCKQITDAKVLSIIDKIPYIIGHCYSNSNDLCRELRKAGYDARIYTGWLFVGEHEYPAFHAWVVLNGSVIDLADDYTKMCVQQQEKWHGTASKKEWAVCMNEFYKEIEMNHVPNSIRISPVGVPTCGLMYVGCESSILHAVHLFIDLMGKYPNHTTKNYKDMISGTETQQYLQQLMGE